MESESTAILETFISKAKDWNTDHAIVARPPNVLRLVFGLCVNLLSRRATPKL